MTAGSSDRIAPAGAQGGAHVTRKWNLHADQLLDCDEIAVVAFPFWDTTEP